ncbi:MAG: DUF5107 domain-containing protein [Bacteroidota bacterium]
MKNSFVTYTLKKNIRIQQVEFMFKYIFSFFLIILFLNFFLSKGFAQKKVNMIEEKVIIPTYPVGEPEDEPLFYFGRTYQGAQGHVYPYPFYDALKKERDDNIQYNMVYLENEYIKVGILPEIGGRVFSALDKTNNYDFIYKQDVIRPALIGMLGAWISGGIEWDFPHHHRARVFLPMDYILIENEDGSKTAWFGELELRDRTRSLIGITVFPGRSYFEATIKLINRTPYIHSLLCFANTGVHVNPESQVIFPPRTEYATYHHKNEMIRWPIGDGYFNGVNYEDVDLSWWKNHPKPTSFFAWNYEDDFFGHYDHKNQAGVINVVNHYITPGKKFFLWGPGPAGKPDSIEYRPEIWNRILTDNSGPYLELMTGAFSDNQPDYSWSKPYETKVAKMYWYPVRDLGGFKYANLNGAINIEPVTKSKIKLGIYTTKKYEQSILTVQIHDKVHFMKTLDIDPRNPWTKEIDLPSKTNPNEIQILLHDSNGEEILTYMCIEKANQLKPEALENFPFPNEIASVEELYFTGLRLQQFHNAQLDPQAYYDEALRRDPGNYQVNIIMGINCLKKGMNEEAEIHLRKAIERSGHMYTVPQNGEAFYYMGIALRRQEKIKGTYEPFFKTYDDAYEAFHKASWDKDMRQAALIQLAELDCLTGDYVPALHHLENITSIDGSQPDLYNIQALLLKSAVYRHLCEHDNAIKMAESVLMTDPLNFRAMYELYLAYNQTEEKEKAKKIHKQMYSCMQANKTQTHIELAIDFGNAGFYSEAKDLLISYIDQYNASSPLLFYYLGYVYEKNGEIEKSMTYYREGSKKLVDFCFPFRTEMIQVFENALSYNPEDAQAYYYLGNIYRYHEQIEKAIINWKASIRFDSRNELAYRNLGLTYARFKKDLSLGISNLEKAVALDVNDPRIITELDRLYALAQHPPEKRLEFMVSHLNEIKKWDNNAGIYRLIKLYILNDHFDKAIEILTTHHFRRWEGGSGIHEEYVNAHVLRGIEQMRKKDYNEAIKDFRAALRYPLNLEDGKSYSGGPESMVYYYLGTAYEKMDQAQQASENFKNSVQVEIPENDQMLRFFKGLSLKKLGREIEAQQVFSSLVKYGKNQLNGIQAVNVFAKFSEESEQSRNAEAHFNMGLGFLGEGDINIAKDHFQQVVELDVYHLWGRSLLKQIP